MDGTVGYAACYAEWVRAWAKADEARLSLEVAEAALTDGGPVTPALRSEAEACQRRYHLMRKGRNLWALMAVRAGLPADAPLASKVRADATECALDALAGTEPDPDLRGYPSRAEALEIAALLGSPAGPRPDGAGSPHGTFGWALERAQGGAKVTRGAWGHAPDGPPLPPTHVMLVDGGTLDLARGGTLPVQPWLAIVTRGEVVAWSPGQGDMLARDWVEAG